MEITIIWDQFKVRLKQMRYSYLVLLNKMYGHKIVGYNLTILLLTYTVKKQNIIKDKDSPNNIWTFD